MKLSDYLMLWKWRVEQFQSILGPLFYVTTLTLLLYPWVAWRLPDGMRWRFAALWVLLLAAVLVAARLWDASGMWRAGQRTIVRRSQYAGEGRLSPKEILYFARLHVPLLEAVGAHEAAERLRRWATEEEER